MCILFVFSDPNPVENGYRLIIASNRDESYKRPAKGAFRCADTDIIGGRDMEPGREGGMWLGLSLKYPKIKFATLLNNASSNNNKINVKGRGPLVPSYLQSEDKAEDFLRNLDSQSYNSFYLFLLEITGSTSVAYLHSNSPESTLKYLGKQFLAFGNSHPESPLRKVQEGKIIFEKIVNENLEREKLVEKLLQLLKSEETHLPDPQLERRSPKYFPKLSSIFVDCKEAGYGTRTHSIILVDANFNIEFIERTMKQPICVEDPVWDVTLIKSKLTQ